MASLTSWQREHENQGSHRSRSRRQRSKSRLRSRSPSRRNGHGGRERSPKARELNRRYERQASQERGFRRGAGKKLAACAVCLGRHPHNISQCDEARTWDDQFSTLAQRVDKNLVMQDGRSVCMDWQREKGCSSRRHDDRHICSGCGAATHGAQDCPRTEKP